MGKTRTVQSNDKQGTKKIHKGGESEPHDNHTGTRHLHLVN